MTRDSKDLAVIAGGAVVAVGAASLAYHTWIKQRAAPFPTRHARLANKTHLSLVVFLDDGKASSQGRTIRWPRRAAVSELLATVGCLFQLDTAPR
jgi:hypothetical protein